MIGRHRRRRVIDSPWCFSHRDFSTFEYFFYSWNSVHRLYAWFLGKLLYIYIFFFNSTLSYNYVLLFLASHSLYTKLLQYMLKTGPVRTNVWVLRNYHLTGSFQLYAQLSSWSNTLEGKNVSQIVCSFVYLNFCRWIYVSCVYLFYFWEIEMQFVLLWKL